MSGYIGDLSERQQEALVQFRDALADVKRPTDTDAFLLRWLRARDFDVAKAETMYRNDLQWRKDNGVDDMLRSYKTPQIVKENFPGIIIHPCKDGRPMWLIPAGVNIKAFVAAITPPVVQRHITYQLEYIESLKRSSSREKEIETQYLVIDYDKFSLLQLYSWQAVKTITDMLTTIEDHFPECLEKCILIHAPYFFPIFWRLVRPFLSQRTVDKVQVFGKEGWKEYLLSIVDAASLPAIWGGDMVGPGNDPQCRHKVNYGGRFEEGLDWSACSVFREADAQKKTVGRRDLWELPVSVTKADTWLSWRFQTASGDLTFGLRSPTGKVLLPPQRLETCSLVPQEGSWRCDTPGTYTGWLAQTRVAFEFYARLPKLLLSMTLPMKDVLEFDNTHSWMKAKTLAYVVDVHPPEETSS